MGMKNKRGRDWIRPNEYYNFKKGGDPQWILIVISLFIATLLQIKWMLAQPSLFEAANNLKHTL